MYMYGTGCSACLRRAALDTQSEAAEPLYVEEGHAREAAPNQGEHLCIVLYFV